MIFATDIPESSSRVFSMAAHRWIYDQKTQSWVSRQLSFPKEVSRLTSGTDCTIQVTTIKHEALELPNFWLLEHCTTLQVGGRIGQRW
jgi:hypothetical protein